MKKPTVKIEVSRNNKKEMITGALGWLAVLLIIGFLIWKF